MEKLYEDKNQDLVGYGRSQPTEVREWSSSEPDWEETEGSAIGLNLKAIESKKKKIIWINEDKKTLYIKKEESESLEIEETQNADYKRVNREYNNERYNQEFLRYKNNESYQRRMEYKKFTEEQHKKIIKKVRRVQGISLL